MIDAVLDHLAVAAESQYDCWPRYVGDLGGAWIGGGVTSGFASYQVEYTNGMKLEVLEPANVEDNDFLRRFLDRNGPGPHHVTFKVPDIEAAIGEIRTAGLDLVGIDLRDPGWKEAFVHPKQAFGIVVQIAQSSGTWEPEAPDRPLPVPVQAPASFDRAVHLVADLAGPVGLFRDILGGTVLAEDDTMVELAWPGPGRIRFVLAETDDDHAHLGGRDGRLHHLDMTIDDPALVAGAVQVDDHWRLDAADNLGVSLHLHRRS